MARTKECTECAKGINGIHGKYCPETGQWVEYAPAPPCQLDNRNTVELTT